MKSFKYILKLTLIIAAVLSSRTASAQSEIGDLLKSGPEDATKLSQAYLSPMFKGFGTALNSGWNYTGHSKNTGRFDLRFSFTGALIPGSDKSFDVTKLGLQKLRPLNPGQFITPTVGGNDEGGIEMAILNDNNQEVSKFTMPGGLNAPFIPAAVIQGTVGLPKGIEVTVRGIPEIKLGDDYGKLSMLGGGIKFEVLPLVFGKKAAKILPFDVGVAFGYTRLNYDLGLDVQRPAGSVPDPSNPPSSTDFSNQKVDMKISAFNTELILSKKLAVFTPFVSLGYNTSKTDAVLKGNYPMLTGGTVAAGNTLVTYYSTFTDPVKIKQTDINGFRGNVGFNLNLAFFRMFAAYSLAEYNTFNAGIGFGIGK